MSTQPKRRADPGTRIPEGLDLFAITQGSKFRDTAYNDHAVLRNALLMEVSQLGDMPAAVRDRIAFLTGIAFDAALLRSPDTDTERSEIIRQHRLNDVTEVLLIAAMRQVTNDDLAIPAGTEPLLAD